MTYQQFKIIRKNIYEKKYTDIVFYRDAMYFSRNLILIIYFLKLYHKNTF